MSRDLLLIAIALFTWGIGESAFFYFQPLYMEQLGASPVGIGTILGMMGIAMTVAHIPAGFLADRFGRRRMMWAAWFLGLMASVLMALATNLTTFTIGILLYGVTAFVISPMNSYITAARGKWSVGRAITTTSASYNAGAVVGPLIGGFIGGQFGLAKIYLFAVLVFSLSTLTILLIRPQPVKFHKSSFFGDAATLKVITGFLPVFFLATFAMYLPQPLTPNYLQDFHHLTVQDIGKLGAIASLGTVAISLGLGRLNARVGFVLGQAAAGVFSVLLVFGTGFPWFAAGYFLLGGYRAARAMATAFIGEIVPPENIGVTYGITETASGVALILAPPVAGFIFERDPSWVYLGAAGLIILSVAASLLVTQRPRFSTQKGG